MEELSLSLIKKWTLHQSRVSLASTHLKPSVRISKMQTYARWPHTHTHTLNVTVVINTCSTPKGTAKVTSVRWRKGWCKGPSFFFLCSVHRAPGEEHLLVWDQQGGQSRSRDLVSTLVWSLRFQRRLESSGNGIQKRRQIWLRKETSVRHRLLLLLHINVKRRVLTAMAESKRQGCSASTSVRRDTVGMKWSWQA